MPLVSKFDFEKRSRLMVGLAVAIVNEALTGKDFNAAVTFSEHRTCVARQLLSLRPDLIGVLPATAEVDANAAIVLATVALTELREADAFLFTPSNVLKPEARAWLRKQFPSRDPNELWGMVDRASAQECWSYRYAAMHFFAEQGKDVDAIAREITAKLKRDGEAPEQHAIAQTPGGIIGGPSQP